MQLLIKQRVFSWTDTYDVYDEKEEPKYFVKAEFFALGHQIHVYDKSGREVGMVKQRLLTLLPAFDIEIDGKEFGSVQKEFSFFKPRYELDYNGWRWRKYLQDGMQTDSRKGGHYAVTDQTKSLLMDRYL